jgi:hypothetical protein
MITYHIWQALVAGCRFCFCLVQGDPMLNWSFRKRCLVLLVVFGLTFVPLLFPPGPLLVSKATTRITGPVDSSGKLRFRQYLNQAYQQVRPEDNGYEIIASSLPADREEAREKWALRMSPQAFVYAWCNRVPAYSFGYRGEDQMPSVSPVTDHARPYFEDLLGKPWSQRRPGNFEHYMLAAQLYHAFEHPWRRQDFPVLSKYVQFSNRVAIDRLFESAGRADYIHPVKMSEDQDGQVYGYPQSEDSLINQSADFDQTDLEVFATAMQLHTTLMIGEGNATAWLKELASLHASIRQRTKTDKRNRPELYSGGGSGYETTMLALYATILRHAGNDPGICQQLTGILDTLPAAQTESEYVDQVLRYYVLDFLQETKQFGTAPYLKIALEQGRHLETLPPLVALGGLTSVFTNWNKEVVLVNKWIDTLAKTVAEPHADRRSEAVKDCVSRMLKSEMAPASRACMTVYLKQYLGDELFRWETMFNRKRFLLRQQLAIERHRHQTGVYPEDLNEVEGIVLESGDGYTLVTEGGAKRLALLIKNHNPRRFVNYRGSKTGYLLETNNEAHPRVLRFHPWSHNFHRRVLESFNWGLSPRYFGGDAYKILRFIDNEKPSAIDQLQQAGAEFFETHLSRATNSQFTPVLIWFAPGRDNGFDDTHVEKLVEVLTQEFSIHIVNLAETQVSSAGLVKLLEMLASNDNLGQKGAITIESPAIDGQVVQRFKELASVRIQLQLPGGELLTHAK